MGASGVLLLGCNEIVGQEECFHSSPLISGSVRPLTSTHGLTGALSTGRVWAIGFVATIGIASSLLFGFALMGFALALSATMLVRKIRLERHHLIPVAVTAVAMLPVIAYYLWTLSRGAAGAKLWGVGLSNIAFAFYELLGFGGLGPPRAASQIADEFRRRCLIVLLVLGLLVSSLCQRFLPNYGKDDYRSASRMAAAALRSGKTVWWVAHSVTAQYYGLGAPAVQTNSGRLIWLNVENERDIRNKPVPDLIFLSKPEIHDPENNVASYINEYGYHPTTQFIAFRIYTRSASRDRLRRV